MISLELKKKIENAKVVSLDIFDTVLNRLTHKPVDVFKIVQHRYEKETKKLMGFPFYEERILAERKARDVFWEVHKTSEINYEHIYEQLVCMHPEQPEELWNHLKKIELEVELEGCVRNTKGYEIYKKALELNKKIIFVSDMYLPQDIIRKMLSKIGIERIDALYVSNEYKRGKHSGELYDIVISDLGVKVEEILHIGDNHHADCCKAEEKGLKHYYIPKISEKEENSKELTKEFLSERNLQDCISRSLTLGLFHQYHNERAFVASDVWEYFGYRYIGPIVYSFVDWLYSEAEKDNVQALCFLARDGWLPMKAYEIMYPNSKIKAQYVYASRRLFLLPAIEKMDDESCNQLMFGKWRVENKYAVKEHLATWGLDADLHLGKLLEAGFAGGDDIVAFPHGYENLKKLFFLLEEEILAKASDERKNLSKYLKKMLLSDGTKKAIVDLGWHASMQKSLESVLKNINPVKEHNLQGYYFGLWEAALKRIAEGQNSKAYANNFHMNNRFARAMTANAGVELLEFSFRAPHGSIINMEKNGKDPLCASFDTSEKELQQLKQIHKGALDFIHEVNKIRSIFPDYSIMPEFVKDLVVDLCNNPPLEIANAFGEIGFGSAAGENYHLIRFAPVPKEIIGKNLVEELDQYRQSAIWKAAFEKRTSTLFVRKIAVIMRTKDRPLLLRRALESVLKQTYPHWYLVIVNDGGKKEPVNALVDEYSESWCGRLRVIHNESSCGMEAASNIGIHSCDSQYIVIHDDDDSWHPTFLWESLQKLVFHRENPYFKDKLPAGIVTHSVLVREVIENNEVREVSRSPFNSDLANISLFSMAETNRFPPISFLFTREIYNEVGSFNEELPVLGDWEFALKVLCKAELVVLPKPIANYHQRVPSTMGIYANSVHQGGMHDKHRLYDSLLRNELLRQDIQEGKLGLGYLVNLQRRNTFHLIPEKERPGLVNTNKVESTHFWRGGEPVSFSTLARAFVKRLKGEKVCIWGTGSTGKLLFKLIAETDLCKQIKFVGFVDNNQAQWGQELFGYKIMNPSEISREELIVIGSQYGEEISDQLRKLQHIHVCDGYELDEAVEIFIHNIAKGWNIGEKIPERIIIRMNEIIQVNNVLRKQVKAQ